MQVKSGLIRSNTFLPQIGMISLTYFGWTEDTFLEPKLGATRKDWVSHFFCSSRHFDPNGQAIENRVCMGYTFSVSLIETEKFPLTQYSNAFYRRVSQQKRIHCRRHSIPPPFPHTLTHTKFIHRSWNITKSISSEIRKSHGALRNFYHKQ